MIQNEINQQTHQSEMRQMERDQTTVRDTSIQEAQRFSMLATLAIVAQVFLLASAWFLPAVSEFSLIGDNISELPLGRFGFVQTLAFIFGGIGTLGLAYALRHFTAGSHGSLAGALFFAVNGIGLILIAFFPTDRIDTPADVWTQSTIGMIHLIISMITFVCAIIGMFVGTWTFARDRRWRSLTVWSGLIASAALSLFFIQGEGPRVGLNQRLLVLLIEGWLMMAAFRVRSLAREAESLASTRPSHFTT